MKINIKDTDKVPVWGIPEAKLHLSFENNGPIPITPSTLSPFHRKVIYMNIMTGILEADDTKELERFLFQKPAAEKKNIQDNLTIVKNGKQSVDMVQRAGHLKKLLNNSVASLRRLLPDCEPDDLNILLNLEKNAKNRKGVIKLIETLKEKIIAKKDSEVASSVGREAGNITTSSWRIDPIVVSGTSRLFAGQLTDIEESEEDDIIIHTGDDSG